MSRIPSLGPRGEGWVALQGIFLVLILVAGNAGPQIPTADGREALLLELVGWLSMGVAATVVLSGVWLLGQARALAAVPRPTSSGSLVDSGPYRFIRHPVYAGLVLGSIGLGLVRLSLPTLALALGLFVVMDLKRRREEAWLAERYPAYGQYRERTRALIPFLY